MAMTCNVRCRMRCRIFLLLLCSLFFATVSMCQCSLFLSLFRATTPWSAIFLVRHTHYRECNVNVLQRSKTDKKRGKEVEISGLLFFLLVCVCGSSGERRREKRKIYKNGGKHTHILLLYNSIIAFCSFHTHTLSKNREKNNRVKKEKSYI